MSGACQVGIAGGVLDAVAHDLLRADQETLVFVSLWVGEDAADGRAVCAAARAATGAAIREAVQGRSESDVQRLVTFAVMPGKVPAPGRSHSRLARPRSAQARAEARAVLSPPLRVVRSLGVGVAFEVARRAPRRVAGTLAVGGVPRGGVPAPPGSAGDARAGAGSPRADERLETGDPAGRGSRLAPVLDTFTRHDWTWFSRLVVEAGRQPGLDATATPFPVTVVARQFDAFVDTDRLCAVAATCPTPASWPCRAATSSPVQQPDAVHAELLDLIARTDLAP